MIKRIFFIGTLCVSLMVYGGTSHALSYAGYLLYKTAGLLPGCPINLEQFWKGINTDSQDYDYRAVFVPICDDPDHPDACNVFFGNPGGEINWQSGSVNFADLVPVSVTGSINIFAGGQKGKASTSAILGDCDNCADEKYTLPQDGRLWLLFDEESSCQESEKLTQNPPDYGWGTERAYWVAVYEDCIKEKIVQKYSPNLSWFAAGTSFTYLNVYIDAYQNGDLVMQIDLENCELSGTEYMCQNANVRRKDFVERTF